MRCKREATATAAEVSYREPWVCENFPNGEPLLWVRHEDLFDQVFRCAQTKAVDMVARHGSVRTLGTIHDPCMLRKANSRAYRVQAFERTTLEEAYVLR